MLMYRACNPCMRNGLQDECRRPLCNFRMQQMQCNRKNQWPDSKDPRRYVETFCTPDKGANTEGYNEWNYEWDSDVPQPEFRQAPERRQEPKRRQEPERRQEPNYRNGRNDNVDTSPRGRAKRSAKVEKSSVPEATPNESTDLNLESDLSPCEPIMLPYSSYFYPCGIFGPKFNLCTYVALHNCSENGSQLNTQRVNFRKIVKNRPRMARPRA